MTSNNGNGNGDTDSRPKNDRGPHNDRAAASAHDLAGALLALGVRPRDGTSLARVREFVNDLYTWELRRLRARMLQGEFPKREYAARVETLRRARYWMLSLPLERWHWSDVPT